MEIEEDDGSMMDDLARAWPADDDLTLSGAGEDNGESEGLHESDEGNNEPAAELSEEGSDTSADSGDGEQLREGGGEVEDGAAPADASQGSPVGLPAAAREEWGNTPKAMQDAIVKREKDFAQGIQRYAESAKRAEGMDRALQPYAQYFAMNNQSPGQGIQQLLQTATQLQTGAPQQRAQLVANLISQFGVDVNVLDKILTDGVPAEGQAPPVDHNVQQQIAQAVAPYKQHMQQIQNQQQQNQHQVQEEAGSEVHQFSVDPKNEFYRDVRADMADLLDMASNRGIQMDMAEAYKKACMLNPEIQKIVSSREAQVRMQSRRRASSSVSGSLGGQGDGGPVGGMRATIEDAWENAGRT